MTFQEKLDKIVKKNNSLISVGLDSNIENIPQKFRTKSHPQFEFNKWIIDQTHDLVCAFKPNSAFYEANGAKGIEELKLTCDYIKNKYPEIPVILDAKRGDIGSTNEGYIQYIFEYLKADAITVQPFLGSEAITPFLELKDKGIIILCKTSNSGAGELQDLKVNNELLYCYIARIVKEKWNYNNNCMLVVGATYPKELREIRKIVGEMTLLVPGIGSQGGDVEKTVKAGLNSIKSGMIINSSRGIIFSKNPRKEAHKLKNEINQMRTFA